jgi:hypothetical protein
MLGGGLGLQLDVVFAPGVADQLKLRLEEIDVLLLALEYFAEEVAGDEVPDAFAMRDRLPQLRHRQLLEPQIAFEDLGHALANQQSVELQARLAA